MKTRILLIAIIAIVCIGCKQGNQTEYVFEKITLSNEDKAALDQIFSEHNNAIRDYVMPLLSHDDCEKCSEGKHKDLTECSNSHTIVEIIDSKKELLAICPEGVKLPNLDFKNYCIVWAGVQTPSSGNSFTSADLEDLGNGEYVFRCTIRISSINCAIGYVFPYAVYSIPKELIRDIEKNIVVD